MHSPFSNDKREVLAKPYRLLEDGAIDRIVESKKTARGIVQIAGALDTFSGVSYCLIKEEK